MNSSQNLALNLAPSPATRDIAPSPTTRDITLNQDLIPDQIPNQINDIPIRIRKAKEFLQENSKEHLITAAHIYNLPESTLWSLISRPQAIKHDEQNQILQEHQKNAIHLFIQSLLTCQIQSIYSLIYNVICDLKHAQNLNLKSPSLDWFSEWWKQNELHRIKAKPLTVICLTAQQEQEIVCWFREYQTTIQEYEIKRKNIVNFDKAGFCVSCFKDQYLLVLTDILEICFELNYYIDYYITLLIYNNSIS